MAKKQLTMQIFYKTARLTAFVVLALMYISQAMDFGDMFNFNSNNDYYYEYYYYSDYSQNHIHIYTILSSIVRLATFAMLTWLFVLLFRLASKGSRVRRAALLALVGFALYILLSLLNMIRPYWGLAGNIIGIIGITPLLISTMMILLMYPLKSFTEIGGFFFFAFSILRIVFVFTSQYQAVSIFEILANLGLVAYIYGLSINNKEQ